MIGTFSDDPNIQDYPVPGMAHLYSDRGDFIAIVGKFGDFDATRKAKALMAGASDLPVFSINAPPLLQGIDFSDHLSYWNAGFPALMITDTAFLRNHQYHRAGAIIVNAPTDQPYGERQYSAQDIGGYSWTFSETIADVDPEAWGGELFEQD